MPLRKKISPFFTHSICGVFGFILGIYLLPILIAPTSDDVKDIKLIESKASYQGQFTPDIKGSDFFHWGDALVSVTPSKISVNGEVAPGPDYKIYLTNQYVEDENEFLAIKKDAALLADLKSFKNFIVSVPSGLDIESYNTIVIWCESFGEFITSAKYR